MSTPLFVAAVSGLLVPLTALTALAQVDRPADAPVVYGHHHVNATNIDEHIKFWVDALGGRAATLEGSTSRIVAFPGVLVFLRQQAPSGGTKGTVVNHVGFQVPDLRAALARARAAGFAVVTRAEAPASMTVTDDMAYVADQQTSIAYVMGPDEVKVELFENKALQRPIALHHIHFYTPDVDGMREWYVKTFGAKAGMRGSFKAADLFGVNLTFSPSTDPVVSTKGRSLDHIGFEVGDLEALVARLGRDGVTFDRPYTKLPNSPLAIAFFTDPWGTYIELTQGLVTVR